MTEARISPEEGKKVQDSINNLRNRYQQKVCKHCSAIITFAPAEDGKYIPHNLDGSPHWMSCPYSGFTQKKKAINILEKVALYLVVTNPTDFDFASKVGLSDEECKIVHAVLEKAFKKANETPSSSETVLITPSIDEFTFKPQSAVDPLGDPDEERAPSEDFIKQVNKESDDTVQPIPMPVEVIELEISVDEVQSAPEEDKE